MKQFMLTGMLAALLMVSGPALSAEPPAPDEALPFQLYKFEPAQLYAKKRVKLAKYELGNGQSVTGRVLTLVYTVTGDHTPLEIAENYKQSLAGEGFTMVKEKDEAKIGQICFSPILEDVCYSTPIYGAGNRLLLKKADAAGDSYVHVLIGQANEAIKGKPKDPARKLPEMTLAAGDILVVVRVVTPQEIQNRMIKENVSYILDQLKMAGKVDLYGVYFDTDKSDIKPESGALIGEIVKALKQDPALSLQIGGHTDNQGSAEHNGALSQRRAEAVLAALTAQGVEAARLTAKGFGATQPVADNATVEGRAKNRRVELAKRS